jgi:hypothetical protein
MGKSVGRARPPVKAHAPQAIIGVVVAAATSRALTSIAAKQVETVRILSVIMFRSLSKWRDCHRRFG